MKIINILILVLFPFLHSETLNIGLSADYPPFEYKNGDKLLGFDVDLAKKIAAMLNMQVEFKEMGFAALFNALEQGEVDLIISSVGKTDEREKNFAFSTPYYYDKLTVIYKKSNPIYPPFKSDNIACQLGSLMEIWCNQNANPKKVLRFDTFNQAIEALKSGHADGVLIDETQAKEFAYHNKDLAYSVIGNSGGGNSVVLHKKSQRVTEINKIIEKLQQDGYLKNLEDKWINNPQREGEKPLSESFTYIFKGAGTTVTYMVLSLIFSFCFGTILAILRNLNIGKPLIVAFVSVVRGTPVILQLSFVYFSLPALLGIKLSVLSAGVLTFGINSSAYVCEILRSGLNSIPKGQFEVCKSLHIPTFFVWKDVILPQAIRTVLPSLVSETVALTKETALVSILGEMDIMRRAQALAAEQYSFFMPLCMAGLTYWILVKVIEIVGLILERKYKNA